MVVSLPGHLRFEKVRAIWALPLLLGAIYLLGPQDDSGVLGAAVVACFACTLTIASADYRPMALVSIFGLMSMVSYPIAAIANLLLDSPAVRADLWEEADLAMWGCAVGAISAAMGAMLGKLPLFNRHTEGYDGSVFDSSRRINVLLSSLLVVVIVVKLNLNLYYHSSVRIGEYGFEFSQYLNLLNWMSWISACGAILQLQRYMRVPTRRDLALLIMLGVAPIVLYLPSGSREAMLGPAVLFLLVYLTWEKSAFRKMIVFASSLSGLLIALIVVAIYRDLASRTQTNLSDLVSVMGDVVTQTNVSELDSIVVAINRLSDFVATGRMIAIFPNVFPYRMFDGIDTWWQIAVPGFLRPIHNQVDFTDGARVTLEYGVSPGEFTSNPIMIIGDLYSRFGWVGVVLGMAIFGFVLQKIDLTFIRRRGTFGLIFFILFAGQTWRLYTGSLLNNVVAFTRDLLLVYIVSYAIVWLLKLDTGTPRASNAVVFPKAKNGNR